MKKNLFLSFLLLCYSSALFSQSNLRYNLKKEDRFVINQLVTQETTIDTKDQNQVIINNLSATFQLEVIDVLPEMYVIDMSFLSSAINISVDGIEMMGLDTNSESLDPSNIMFKGMINKKVTMHMLPNGKIIEVNNGENIIDGMIEAIGDIDQTMIDNIREGLKKDFSGETLAYSLEQMTYYYPTSKKEINDTWNNKYKGEGKINTNNEWKYISEDANTRIIEGTASVTMNLNVEPMFMKLSGEQQTVAKIDPASGFFKEIVVTTTTSGNSYLSSLPDEVNPTSIKMNTTYTLQ